MNPIRVQFRRVKGYRLPADTVLVTRPGRFGNPFRLRDLRAGIPGVATTDEAVAEFERWLDYSSAGRAMAQLAREQLRGKNLACFCPLNKKCHADVLLRVANEPISHAKESPCVHHH